ncbi:TVP38/TMEM64 family protein [Lichenicola cladoniae]|uniref:TVP38/TMEM64 family membrane protein n=1 Tax=Lichenicola cladoniae TaxID=1484109 RepID=A0A6M8HP14_9PROT|nr:VTT domain-containing protein [Lichenicola cladoniae]NPD68362.1 TVP38/TMEM64 family protein [Acetobacteraceae bacterium]QKE90144.1 TVP38/TMEM64 family protein [Lichenicola cladoniae]
MNSPAIRTDSTARSSGAFAIRVALAVVLLLVVVAGIVGIRVWPHRFAHGLSTMIEMGRSFGAVGWLLAALIQILIALCGILPASVGALAAGMLYGIVPGFLLSGVATLIGAALAFMLTRSLFRPFIARTLLRWPRIGRLDDAVAQDGWRLVCLLRISPIMPFAVTSYALGLTSLRMRQYMIGTLASLPALLGYVVLGKLAGAGLSALSTRQAQPLRWILLALAIAATALLTLRLGRIIARIMQLPTVPRAAQEPDTQRHVIL